MKKKRRKLLILFALLLILAGVIFFVIPIIWIMKLNARVNTFGDNLPTKFRVELPLERDSTGYFCVTAKINDLNEQSFILDTYATSMLRIDVLEELGAHYWDKYPVKVKNLYGQKENLPLYELNSISIVSLIIDKPLFKGISKTNALYDLLYKGLIGKDILKHFVWKFSLDENKLILFSNKDRELFQSEIQGYTLIKNGLEKNKAFLTFPTLSDSIGFIFDLGYQGEICIDKRLFEKLYGKYPCDKHLNARTVERVDTTYSFKGIEIEWGGIRITDVEIVYLPVSNSNLIGVEFAEKFNFILGYQKTENFYSADLLIQPRINLESIKSNTDNQDFGFNIRILDGELLVTSITIDGLAEKAGIKLKDRVIEIDNGAVDLNMQFVKFGLVKNYIADKDRITLKVEREGKLLEYVIKK